MSCLAPGADSARDCSHGTIARVPSIRASRRNGNDCVKSLPMFAAFIFLVPAWILYGVVRGPIHRYRNGWFVRGNGGGDSGSAGDGGGD